MATQTASRDEEIERLRARIAEMTLVNDKLKEASKKNYEKFLFIKEKYAAARSRAEGSAETVKDLEAEIEFLNARLDSLARQQRGAPAGAMAEAGGEMERMQGRLKALQDQTLRLTTSRDRTREQLDRVRTHRDKLSDTLQSFQQNIFISLLRNDLAYYEEIQATHTIAADYDIVFAHNFDTLLTANMVIEHHAPKARMFFDCIEHPVQRLRTPGVNSYFFEGEHTLSAAYEGFIETTLRQSRAVVAITSPGHKAFFAGFGFDAHLLYNTKALARQSPKSRDVLADGGVAEKDRSVLYLNNIYPQGGFDDLLRMVRNAKDDPDYDLKLLVLGRNRDRALEEELAELQGDAFIQDRIRFLDLVPPNEIVNYIADVECIVSPFDSRHQGYRELLPIRLFDAVLAGVPIVVPAESDMGALVAEAGIGAVYHDAVDPEARTANIRAAIDVACGMKDSDAFRAASAAAKPRFDWAGQHAIFERIIRESFGADARKVCFLANKPIRNNSRVSNFIRSFVEMGLECDVISRSMPDPALQIAGANYIEVG